MIYYLILSLISFLSFLPALGLYFVGDDYSFLAIDQLTYPLFIHPQIYHYVPIPWVILLILKYFFKTNPFPYHFLVLIIHIVNVLLVKKISALFFKRKIWQFICALLFSVFFANYEVVFWITGIFIALSFTFYLLCFSYFAKLLKNSNFKNFLLFNLFFCLSILSHEYGLTVLIFCLGFMLYKSKINFKLLFPPALIFSIVSLIKAANINSSLLANSSNPRRFAVSLFNFITYAGFPNPFYWEILYIFKKNILVVSVFTLMTLIFSVLLIKKIINNKLVVYQISVIILSGILFSLTSWTQMRYFYYFAFPSSIIWVCIFSKFKNKLLLKLSLILFIAPQIIFLMQRTKEWTQASKIVRNETCQSITNNKNLISSIGDDRWKAYIFTYPENMADFLFDSKCN